MSRFFSGLLNKKGSISISVALILLAVCVLSLVFVDYARAIVYKRDIEDRLGLAVSSVMSYYDYILAKEYGLYGFCITGNYDATTLADRYFRGCNFEDDRGINLLSYDSIEVSAALAKPLCEPDVLQSQIVDIMKYKSTANLIEYVMELFDIAKEADTSKGLYALSGECAQVIENTSETLVMLEYTVEGYFDGDRLCVNGFEFFAYDTLIESALENNPNDPYYGIKLVRDTFSEYLEYNNTALYYCNELNTAIGRIDALIKDAEDLCREDESAAGTFESLISQLREQRNSISNLKINNDVSENVIIFQEMISSLDSFIDSKGNPAQMDNILAHAKEVNVGLEVRVVRSPSDDSYTKYDTRDETQTQYNDSVNQNHEDDENSGEIDSSIYTTLPSVLAGKNTVSFGDVLDTAIDLSGFDSIGMMLGGDFLGGIKDAATDLVNTALVDDYALTYMNHRLEGSCRGPLVGEIEYIIAGNKTDSENFKEVRNKIFMLRFVLNIIHVFRDGEKRALANAIGNAIAASCSYGVGGAVFALVIIAAWSLAETFSDISLLLDGKSVPLVKKKSDWRLSIDGLFGGAGDDSGDNKESALDKMNDFGYAEYLRVLLMMTPSDSKLLRIADIIELNMGVVSGRRYRLAGIYNEISLSACVDMNLYATYFVGKSKEAFYMEVTSDASYS